VGVIFLAKGVHLYLRSTQADNVGVPLFAGLSTWGAILLLISAILSPPARADDPARVTLMPYDCSGFYGGGHFGYAWEAQI